MVRVVVFALFALAALPCAAQYPGKPIRIVIPFVAGGSSDIVGRAIGSKFQECLQQPAVVENRPGANGAIAAEFVAKSDADGYTILVGSIGVFSINAALFKDLRYQPLRDFAPITLAVTTPNVLIAKPTLPPDSVKDLVELEEEPRAPRLLLERQRLVGPSHRRSVSPERGFRRDPRAVQG